jgi:hypothetical protein
VGAGEDGGARATFAERRAALEDGDASGLVRLAIWCRENGLSVEAKRCWGEALAADPDNTLARRALGYEKVEGVWLRGDALRKARGFVRLNGRWALREEVIAYEAKQRESLLRDEESKEAMERAAHLVRALGAADERSREAASLELSSLPVETTFRPLVAALNSAVSTETRLGAVEVLSGYEPRDSLRPLVRASLMDDAEPVRDAALAAVKAYRLPGILAPYATALASSRPELRTRAVKAIGGLGDVQGVGMLIRFWESYGGGSPRSYIFEGTQLAFVQDFDVEVAQTAFIADPIVGTLQEGASLEVQVIGTVRKFTTAERQLIRRSLKSLTGVDQGDDVAAWLSWEARQGRRVGGAPADLKPTKEMR